jgi:hypothetical protein
VRLQVDSRSSVYICVCTALLCALNTPPTGTVSMEHLQYSALGHAAVWNIRSQCYRAIAQTLKLTCRAQAWYT